MGLNVYLTRVQKTAIYEDNITHNLGKMAKEAGIYTYLWRPDEIGITQACELIEPLREGLHKLKSDPERFRAFDSPNGYGTYTGFVKWLERYLEACYEYPDAQVEVSR